MKNILVVFFLLLAIQINAQDTIYLKSQSRILGVVREIDDAFITYSVPEQDSIYLMVSKNDVHSIRYSSGYRENFETENAYREMDYYQRGLDDSKKYYNGGPDFTKGVFDGVLTYFMYSGVVLIIIDFRKDPKISYPYGVGFEDNPSEVPDYRKGYEQGASKIKKKKLLGGYLTGLLAFPIVFTGIVAGIVAAGM